MNQEIFSVRRDSFEIHSLLFHGEIFRHGEVWTALPREVVANSTGVESIIFEALRKMDAPRPSFWKKWWGAIRPEYLPLTFMPLLSVFLEGLRLKWDPLLWVSCLSVLGVLFFQTSLIVLSEVEDHLRLIDLPGGNASSSGRNGVIQKGWISARKLRQFGYGVLGLGVLAGLPAVILNPSVLILVGALGTLGVLTYSNRPWGMKYRTIGDVALFFLLGPVLTVGFSQATFGRLNASVLFLGFFFGFISWAGSQASRLQEMSARIGFKSSRHLCCALYSLAYVSGLSAVFLGFLPQTFGFALLLGIPGVIRLLSQIYKISGPRSALLTAIKSDASQVTMRLGLLIWAALLLSI